MTEQEAEALAAKLRPIWGCDFYVVENFGQYKRAVLADNGIYAVMLRLITRTEVLIGCYTSSLAQFERDFGPSIRKFYWLSGANIECTEHEKLEWMLWLRDREEAERSAPLLL